MKKVLAFIIALMFSFAITVASAADAPTTAEKMSEISGKKDESFKAIAEEQQGIKADEKQKAAEQKAAKKAAKKAAEQKAAKKAEKKAAEQKAAEQKAAKKAEKKAAEQKAAEQKAAKKAEKKAAPETTPATPATPAAEPATPAKKQLLLERILRTDHFCSVLFLFLISFPQTCVCFYNGRRALFFVPIVRRESGGCLVLLLIDAPRHDYPGKYSPR
jgi:flagellar motor protein MotB